LFCAVSLISSISFAQTPNTLPTVGNIGVGTATPATKLDVVGNTALRGTVKIDSMLIVKDSLQVQKKLIVGQNIKVTGKSVFTDNVKAKANLNVLGVTKLKNKLIADSLSRFKSKVVIDGLTKMKGNATILGNLKLPNLSTINNTALFLSTNIHGKVGGISAARLASTIYQLPQTCLTDQNGNVLAVWKQTPHPNYGILFTGTDCPTRVGIGIANPINALDVDGKITMRVGASAGFIPTADATGTMTWTDPSAIITGGLWQTNAANIYFSTGNVGIGTATPQYPLDVSGIIHAQGNIINGGSDFILGVNDGRPQGTIASQRALVHSLTGDELILNYGGDFEGGLHVSGSKTVFDGSVGIGTATPEDKLQIGDNTGKLVIGDAGGASFGWGTSYIGFNASRQNASTWSTTGDTKNDGGAVIYADVQGSIFFATIPAIGGADQVNIPDATVKNNTRLFIHKNGNVGIGTRAVAGYKLSVEGGVRARSIQVDATNITWWDDVLTKNYQLTSLTEVEKYLTKHKHLPDVPSAKEVKEKGIDLGNMNAILLKKVEELTLYMIQMNKEIAQLKVEH